MSYDTKKIPKLSGSDLSRFWSKVDKASRQGPNGDCWEWVGCREGLGYGTIGIEKRNYRAHRVMFSITRGDIPHGLCVLHRCDNPACVNPAHLWLGTNADNVHDRNMKGRANIPRGKGHWRSKLSANKVREIRKKSATGEWFQRELAAEYGVCIATVNQVLHRKRWAHVKS